MVANRRITFTAAVPVTEKQWAVAFERTRGLALERLRWDGDLNNLLANAYLQGVVDVGLNFNIISKLYMEMKDDGAERGTEYFGA